DLPVYKTFGANAGSEIGFLKVLHWMQDCIALHQRCAKNSSTPLPRRVLDLESLNAKDNLSVHESDNETGRYMCLSHCWGGSKYPAKTTSLTLEQNKESIPWDSLPKKFQDAIVFTRWLKVRYLWIDSLCIIQDSGQDWLESVKMVDIYRNSFLTIASTSDGGGLFYPTLP
ncbi:heterokaryon incompatibility protein-domain-containing protein, partial [Lasiosphaeria miniovina]